MTFGMKSKGGLLGVGHKVRAMRHDNALGQKLGHGLNIGGRIVSNTAKTGALVTGIAGAAMAGTPQGAGLTAASKGLLVTSIVAGEASKGGSRMEKKSIRLQEKQKLKDLENSNDNYI